jgi:hypothetical protein
LEQTFLAKTVISTHTLGKIQNNLCWKVLEGMVPNCGVEASDSGRLSRICKIPELTKKAPASIKTLRENSFQIHGPRLFNCHPVQIRNLKNCSVEEFKTDLDLVLEKVADEPKVSGSKYTPSACDLYSGNPSDSIIDQIRIATIPSKLKLRRTGH